MVRCRSFCKACMTRGVLLSETGYDHLCTRASVRANRGYSNTNWIVRHNRRCFLNRFRRFIVGIDDKRILTGTVVIRVGGCRSVVIVPLPLYEDRYGRPQLGTQKQELYIYIRIQCSVVCKRYSLSKKLYCRDGYVSPD